MRHYILTVEKYPAKKRTGEIIPNRFNFSLGFRVQTDANPTEGDWILGAGNEKALALAEFVEQEIGENAFSEKIRSGVDKIALKQAGERVPTGPRSQIVEQL